MIELLQILGLSTLAVIGVALAVYLLKEIFRMVQATRLKAQQTVLMAVLAELDAQLSEFYMPLTCRFRVSKLLFETTIRWQSNGKYSNDYLAVKSEDPKALRNLVVRRVFLPFNREVERLLLEKGHLASSTDKASYAKILQHMILWRSFEEAMLDNDISDYEGTAMLQFPAEDVAKCIAECESLLGRRDQVRNDLLTMRLGLGRVLGRKPKRKEKTE